MNNNRWKPGVAHYTYDVNGHLLGAIDEIGLKSFNYISNAQGRIAQIIHLRTTLKLCAVSHGEP